MGRRDRNGTVADRNHRENGNKNEEEERDPKGKSREIAHSGSEEEDRNQRDKRKSKKPVDSSGSDSDSRGRSRTSEIRRRSRRDDDSDSEESEYSESGSDTGESETETESEEERRSRKRKERRRREREEERERKRRKKEKEKRRRRKEREEGKRKKEKKEKERKKKEKLERGKKGAVTDTWGKYGIIREIDMWNKRPEFTAWLAEVKQVNLESLPNWEEKQMFKEFMEDYNTATFPSKKYYNLDAYYGHKMEKEQKKGVKKVLATERTVFNDEEQRRQELLHARERQKEEEVEALKRSMQSGMAQAMKDQARLREEMAYQYKLGNFEAAAAIQRRLDPDVAL